MTKKKTKIPNPGSDEAIELGCTCPVLDNGHGHGAYGQTDLFWNNGDCPLHTNAGRTANEMATD